MTPSLKRRAGLTLERIHVQTLVFAALLFPAATRAQTPLLDAAITRTSLSGQFVVIGVNPALRSPRLFVSATNAEFARLDPALLAVSAERVKQRLWRQLGIDSGSPRRGRIFLALYPAVSLDENVAIIARPLAGKWIYRVELPDVVSRTRLVRALTGVVLLELANRDNSGVRSAEIPAWLIEGLAQQVLSEDPTSILSAPEKLVPVAVPSAPSKLEDRVPESRITINQRGVDALAKARAVLRDHPALTLDQLSWPDNAQLLGDDGGVYRASAQLFVNDLLALKDGAAHLRVMLQMLPRCYNWQIAFRAAFRADFPQPIDAEKWWALQNVSFDAHETGPLWTPAVSRARLDEILSVPVEMRSAPTSLPVHAAVSIQDIIRNLDFNRQAAVLQAKLRDLDLAHWRMAPQFVALTDAYRRVLAEYLGERNGGAPVSGRVLKLPSGAPSRRSAADAVKKLDALDAQRRAIETARVDVPDGKLP
jgi:hypothetical protein